MLSIDRVQQFLSAMPGQTIALVGDLYLDRYLEIEPGVHELSIETGLEAYQITRVRNSPGAMGTVMNNLAALGVGRLLPVTVIGDDGHGFDLLRALQRLPVSDAYILQDPARLTPTYTKPLRGGRGGTWEELNRLDIRAREPLRAESVNRLCENLRRAWNAADGLMVLDQVVELNWGVVNDAVRQTLVELQLEQPEKLLFIDSRAHLGKFVQGILKGNRTELLRAQGHPEDAHDRVKESITALARRNQRAVFCTLGEAGMLVADPESPSALVAGYRAEGPVDIVGAGDAASSGIVTALLAGGDPREAAAMGNLVASITVQQLGTTGTATPAQVLARASRGSS